MGRLLAILLLATLTACATIPPPPLAGNSEVRSGQVAYEGEKSFVAEFVLRQSGADDFNLELFKGIGAPILTVRVVRGEAWAGGAMAKHNWHGRTASFWMPKPLAGWAGLAEVFARLPATDVPGWKIEIRRDDAGEMRQLEVVRESSEERFDFRFE